MFNRNPKIERLITAMDCEIDFIKENVISLDDGLWHIVIDEDHPNNIFLYLHVDVFLSAAANIANRLSLFANAMGMNVIVQDVYAFKLDQVGDIVGMTYGSDAYESVAQEYYFGIYE